MAASVPHRGLPAPHPFKCRIDFAIRIECRAEDLGQVFVLIALGMLAVAVTAYLLLTRPALEMISQATSRPRAQ